MTVTRHEEIDMGDITIRRANGKDRAAIERLAALDSQSGPQGGTLLGFDGEALVAAVPLDGGRPIADPFRRTAEIVDLLLLRAAQGEMPTTVRRQRHLRGLGLAQERAA